MKALEEVLESQHFILGPKVEKFEKDCAAYCGCKYAMGISSGTDALLMALMALDVKPGDEVITTNYSFFATASVIHRLGARPVFVDIDPKTYNIQEGAIEKAVTPRTKAILPVHLYGHCAEMDVILEVARRRGVAVIEDAAQSFGASYRGHKAGAMGDIGCVSFYPTKNLGGIGEGGLITLDKPDLYQKLLDLRNQGSVSRGPYQIVGGNFRLDAVQAAALSVKLGRLPAWNRARAERAATYCRLFAEAGLKGMQLPVCLPHCEHIYHQFVVRLSDAEDRDKVQKLLKEKGVDSAVYYPRTLQEEPCFAPLGYRKQDYPVSNQTALTGLALPIYPELTEEQQRHVVDCFSLYYRK